MVFSFQKRQKQRFSASQGSSRPQHTVSLQPGYLTCTVFSFPDLLVIPKMKGTFLLPSVANRVAES